MYWTTSSALALSCMDEFEPLNWKILDLVSRIKMSSWFREDRAKGTCHQQKQIKLQKRHYHDMVCVCTQVLYIYNLHAFSPPHLPKYFSKGSLL